MATRADSRKADNIAATAPPKSAMKFTHNPRRTTTITACLLLLTTACVVSPENTTQENEEVESAKSDSPSTDPKGQEIIASSSTSATKIGKEFQIDVYALENIGEGRLRLRFGVTNNSGSPFQLYSGLGAPDNPQATSGITLLDAENRKRHLNYEQSDGSCFCSPINGNIGSNETLEMWIIYPAPPADVDSMTITNPLTPPLLNVPISQSSETVENAGISEPKIIDLVTIADDLDDQTGRTESGDEVSIILSSDVLFETNSSNLSPDAQEILEQVAAEIDSASSSIVNIDGHADNTGSESINLPLSKERAESVESALSELTTRSGVTFEVEGHGATDPIASNDTEEGRERNRRVSVTFEK